MRRRVRLGARIGLVALIGAVAAPATPVATARSARRGPAEAQAQRLLEALVPLLQPVLTATNQARWVAATDVSDEHSGMRAGAETVAAAVSGSRLVITQTKALLAQRAELQPLTARQLEKLRLAAAEAPATLPDVVAARIAAEAEQSKVLDGFTFCRTRKKDGSCGQVLTANEIDERLRTSLDLEERQRVWLASKEIGSVLRPGLTRLQHLRNQVARELGFSSFFALQVADYGMSVAEMMTLLDTTLKATQPLFAGLHCWAATTLAHRYGQPVPALLPAHWVGNRWAQHWPGLVSAAGLDSRFAGKTPQWIVETAERFYVSLGFAPLPKSFWSRSDLYPVPAGSARRKNSHASAWHIDLGEDVRSLMSVEANESWFATAHHELGHIYYFLAYSRPEVPLLLRDGANRAFHEAIGELAKLASQQTPYLRHIGVLPANEGPDAQAALLESALDSLVFLPFAAGTMSHFERDLYEDELPASAWQERWWQYARRYQGVVPPGPRPAEGCDACTKTHINDDPAQYYDYALATLIKFQLHDHICRRVLHQDVRACDYAGHQEVGAFLRQVLAAGATKDWRVLMREATGEDIGPRALLEYFAPLLPELARRNAGQACAADVGS